MAQEEVVITYETLFELLQREKDRSDLQKLESTFFSDSITYIQDKKKIINTKSDSPFAEQEKKKTEKQLENIHKIIKELYERREKKIINLALDKSRTKSDLIDTTALLKEEKVFFDALTGLLDTYRGEILDNVLDEKIPFMQTDSGNPSEGNNPSKDKPKGDFETALDMKKPDTTRLVRFIESVTKFVGPELEEYGPFEAEDIANLPEKIADILIDKSKVEEIKEE